MPRKLYYLIEKITRVSGQAIYVPGDDIDTDRIIPARFMKCVTFDGLGEYLFYDVRYDSDNNLTDHALNNPEFAKASIMLSGMNFGCGSSREHALSLYFGQDFEQLLLATLQKSSSETPLILEFHVFHLINIIVKSWLI